MNRALVPRQLCRGIIGLLLILVLFPSIAGAQNAVLARADHPLLASLAHGVAAGAGLLIQGLELQTRGEVELDLVRFSVFTDDAVILAGEQQVQVPENAYFRGVVAGMPGSRAISSLFHLPSMKTKWIPVSTSAT